MKKFLISSLIFLIVAGSSFAQVTGPGIANYCGLAQSCGTYIATIQTAAGSTIPVTDNTFDLGSTSKTWRTLYTGTSRIAKTSDILRVRQDAQRLFTWDASSDTAFTATFGDGGTTAAQTLMIGASTADADDDSSLNLASGGASDRARGALITLYGNESAAGNGHGAIDIIAGNDSSSATAGIIGFFTGNQVLRWSIDRSIGDLNAAYSGNTLALQEATAGAACMGTLTANGATPVVTSTTCATTGSRIFLSRTSAETGVVTAWTSAISTGVSFSITGEAGDTGTYNWIIFHEAP